MKKKEKIDGRKMETIRHLSEEKKKRISETDVDDVTIKRNERIRHMRKQDQNMEIFENKNMDIDVRRKNKK